MLELEGVAKRFGDAPALADLTLAVPRGRTAVLLGPSGCGKSTALRIAIGLVRPDRGSVRLAGEPLTPATAMRLRRRMGYVIQDGGLFPHLTARENVLLAAPGASQDRLEELAALARLAPGLWARYPAQLSGGERQRVALVRALVDDPDVLLLDEPLGALDPIVRADLQDDLRAIFRALGKAVLMVTHDLAEAVHFGDELVLLRAGQVVQRGPARALLAAPADDFARRFVAAHRSLAP